MSKSDLQSLNHLSDNNIIEFETNASSRQLAWLIAQAADDRQAKDIVLLDVGGLSYLTDYFVIATGFSKAQVKAISDSIEAKVAKELGKSPLRIEGQSERSWILHDYGDVIVHIFLPQEREYYDLEAFWGGAAKITFSAQQNSSI